jgi:hypothetical protein
VRFLNTTHATLGAVNADGSPALPTGKPVFRAWLVRVTRVPRSVPLARFRRWRWGVQPDPRTTQVRGASGYTFTQFGASREIAKRITRGGDR